MFYELLIMTNPPYFCYQEDGWSKPAFKATTYTVPFRCIYIYTTLSVLCES